MNLKDKFLEKRIIIKKTFRIETWFIEDALLKVWMVIVGYFKREKK